MGVSIPLRPLHKRKISEAETFKVALEFKIVKDILFSDYAYDGKKKNKQMLLLLHAIDINSAVFAKVETLNSIVFLSSFKKEIFENVIPIIRYAAVSLKWKFKGSLL